MHLLIIGAGGREHALAWKFSQNARVKKIYIAPGNACTHVSARFESVHLSGVTQHVQFAQANNIALTIVGSEELLVAGIVDAFRAQGLRIFGADKQSARLEGSKAYAKDFMKKYGIKTAKYEVFNEAREALAYVENYRENYPLVIKASGLAAGKGVLIVQNKAEAVRAVRELMLDKTFGEAGAQIVVEEFLQGVEASVLSLTDTRTITPMLSAKDHKKIGEGERGLNTGGMGVICPNPYVTPSVWADFEAHILRPTLRGMQAEAMDFEGFIFFGLMITKAGVYLLEYNMRMGDPETQAVLPLLENDLLDVLESALTKKLSACELRWKRAHTCCVVAAAAGYPLSYEKNNPITGMEKVPAPSLCFMAGVKWEDGVYKTSGGRVLNVVGQGETAEAARETAYQVLTQIHFKDMYFRRDIGMG